MDYASYTEELRRRKLDSPATRFLTGVVILTLHVLIIAMTVLWGGGCRSTKEPKEKIYKVKLGGSEPSHAPEVGPPERLRPTGNTSPAPPEPAVKPLPKPAPKEPSVKPLPPKPKPKPKPKPRPAPKEPKIVKPKPRPQSKSKPAPREPSVKPSPSRSNPRNSRQQTRQRSKPKDDDGIYHPPGGSNFNPNVKIGSRDAGQVRGPVDNKTPMAGKNDEADQKWQNGVQKYVEMLWTPPENVFWKGEPPRAVLELVIDSGGRVLSARLVKSSGNARMDGSIQNLIQQLKTRKLPVPPDGKQAIEVELIPR